ncbi:MAG: cell wall-binding repeat-containing protein [Catenulispora sp.]|nr:cell wall-binding repeat-containing protein [Catenulispora sp.]
MAGRCPTVKVTDAKGATVTSAACTLSIETAKDSVHRYAGDDRYLTSAAVSQKLWADAVGGAGTQRLPAKSVVLASGEGFADALAGPLRTPSKPTSSAGPPPSPRDSRTR